MEDDTDQSCNCAPPDNCAETARDSAASLPAGHSTPWVRRGVDSPWARHGVRPGAQPDAPVLVLPGAPLGPAALFLVLCANGHCCQ